MPINDWQKSSYSNEGANCLYVAACGGHTFMLRESEEPEVILNATAPALTAFLGAIKAGRFHRSTTH